jgi:mannose-6-phosphate isomerase-like protein (cupin superfamily)
LLVDNEPGQGPGLHRHPYSETWVVRAGRALITADEEVIEARPATSSSRPILRIFRNLGPGRLAIVCIHAAGRMITEWLDDSPTA